MTAGRVLDAIRDLYERVKPLLILGAIALLAFGFEFKTPAAHLRELREVDGRLWSRQDSLEFAHDEINKYLRALAVAQCLDRPPREWQLMGLPCENLLRGDRP